MKTQQIPYFEQILDFWRVFLSLKARAYTSDGIGMYINEKFSEIKSISHFESSAYLKNSWTWLKLKFDSHRTRSNDIEAWKRS